MANFLKGTMWFFPCTLNLGIHVSFFRENRLWREHEMRVKQLNERKRKFQEELNNVDKQLKDFKIRDKMSEADNYVIALENISKKLEEFNMEVLKIDQSQQSTCLTQYTLNIWCYFNRKSQLIERKPCWQLAIRLSTFRSRR